MSLRLLTPFLFSLSVALILMAPVTLNNLRPSQDDEEIFNGDNTIRYALNDQVIENDQIQAELSHSEDLFYLNIWMGEALQDRITFVVRDEVMKPGVIELDNPSKRYLSFQHHTQRCTFASDDYYTGMLMIHEFDTAKNTIAGSFEFIAFSETCEELLRVSDGVFDATYSEY